MSLFLRQPRQVWSADTNTRMTTINSTKTTPSNNNDHQAESPCHNDCLLRMDQVSKIFPVTHDRRKHLKAIVNQLGHGRAIEGHQVLSGISLCINRGDSLGIIGENGAGKSTLLKLITSVLHPTRGEIRLNARTAALLELGAGFHPEFSGLDNLRLVAAIAGLNRQQIAEREQAIIEFADIGDYIHHPVKHYSSGMVVRLGFAIMTQTDPELLITDEALAVGDSMFQRKCQRWIDQFLDSGGTMILVSHGMDQVKRLCRRAIWLHEGQIRAEGDTSEVVAQYLTYQDQRYEQQHATQPPSFHGTTYGLTRFVINARESVQITAGDPFTIEATLHSPDQRPPVIAIGIKTAAGTAVFGTTSEMAEVTPRQVSDHRFEIQVQFDSTLLQPGEYRVFGHAMDPEGLRLFDTVSCALHIEGVRDHPDGFVRLMTE